MLKDFISSTFQVDEIMFLEALQMSPGAQGAIHGAISEILLKEFLENNGFEVLRIKEKPAGGNNAKSLDAKGDFYIRKKDNKNDEWYVVECKGLKTNSEFRGSKLDSPDKVFRYLKNLTFNKKSNKEIYEEAYNKYYLKSKKKWESDNPDKSFPEFKWDMNHPGPINADLDSIWKNEKELKDWVYKQDLSLFTEESYRKGEGIIKILETHKPSSRKATFTGVTQTAPLVSDFSILAVDLFFRTGKHEFVFMNPQSISHSPSSPEHLYQNYTIDVLVNNLKSEPIIKHPWYSNIFDCIEKTNVPYRNIDLSQVDNRL